tara:strand:- start:7049 stop:8542 length:1494 start_codon:yes stop_codon:yes gene_type:complete
MGQSASPSATIAAPQSANAIGGFTNRYPQGGQNPTNAQINPGRALSSIASQVLGRPTSRAPISPAPTQNVFQQSADALRGAQDTYGRLSSFTPQQITADTAPAATVRPAAQAGAVSVAPAASYGGATIGDIERIQAAQLGPAREMTAVGAVRGASAPGQIAVDQLQSRDIQEYMNPFQDQVINPVADAIERQRKIAQEDLEGQAARTRNFGSRLNLGRDRLAEAALRQTGQALSPLYQQGFGSAMQARQFDVSNLQEARKIASSQQMEAARLQQQADEAGAAREQASRSGNMQAANQFAQIQANLKQRSAEANQRAQNNALTQEAQFAQQANLQSMQAANNAARQQAQIDAQIELANIAAQNKVGSQQAEFDQQAIQADLNRTLQANTQNAANQLAAANQQRAAAGGLSNVAQQALSAGQQVQAAQSAQGALQRGLQQQLINNAQAGGQRYLGAPAQGLNSLLGTITGAGVPNTAGTQESFTPGLFNYLQVASQFGR